MFLCTYAVQTQTCTKQNLPPCPKMLPNLNGKQKQKQNKQQWRQKKQSQHNRNNPWVESKFAEHKSLPNLEKETVKALLKLYTACAWLVISFNFREIKKALSWKSHFTCKNMIIKEIFVYPKQWFVLVL